MITRQKKRTANIFKNVQADAQAEAQAQAAAVKIQKVARGNISRRPLKNKIKYNSIIKNYSHL